MQRRAHRKLLLVNAAERIEDLRVPPGNRLERLKGDRAGQHSIQRFWMNLQTHYDLEIEKRRLRGRLAKEVAVRRKAS